MSSWCVAGSGQRQAKIRPMLGVDDHGTTGFVAEGHGGRRCRFSTSNLGCIAPLLEPLHYTRHEEHGQDSREHDNAECKDCFPATTITASTQQCSQSIRAFILSHKMPFVIGQRGNFSANESFDHRIWQKLFQVSHSKRVNSR